MIIKSNHVTGYSPKIKSYTSFYNSIREGQLKYFNYKAVKGEPRPSWTYRANRRNMAHKRIPLTSLANVIDVDSHKQSTEQGEG